MKQYLFSVVMALLINHSGISQIRNPNYKTLTAIKKERTYHFFTGDKIAVTYEIDDNIKEFRGILTDFTDNGMRVPSFKKRNTSLQYISVDSIISVYNLKRKSRLEAGVITGVALTATILLIIASTAANNNHAVDNFAGVLAFLTGTGAATGTIVFLSTYISEQINKKSIKKGWHFYLK